MLLKARHDEPLGALLSLVFGSSLLLCGSKQKFGRRINVDPTIDIFGSSKKFQDEILFFISIDFLSLVFCFIFRLFDNGETRQEAHSCEGTKYVGPGQEHRQHWGQESKVHGYPSRRIASRIERQPAGEGCSPYDGAGHGCAIEGELAPEGQLQNLQRRHEHRS